VLTFAQVVCEVGKAVGAEGLVAGQIVDIKSEGMAEQVMEEASYPFRIFRPRCNEPKCQYLLLACALYIQALVHYLLL
jgi:hypothetical protein